MYHAIPRRATSLRIVVTSMVTPKKPTHRRKCARRDCPNWIAPTARANQLYCSATCSKVTRNRRLRVRQRKAEIGRMLAEEGTAKAAAYVERLERQGGLGGPDPRPVQARRGPAYLRFCEAGWPRLIATGRMGINEAAKEAGTNAANVSRWMAAWEEDEAARIEAEGWEMPDLARRCLDDFVLFRGECFHTETGDRYQTTEFHLRWLKALLLAMERGRRLIILSPPRHGKTDLLIHFCIWLIVRNPNIRIIWVGPNENIAKMAVGSITDHLENNARLCELFLAPNQSFRPVHGSGKSWGEREAVVATRTVAGIKSPTIVALGKRGAVLSRDADLVVGDDIFDLGSSTSPTEREKDTTWLNTQFGSRKEDHTAVALAGSRQDPKDVWGKLLANPMWATIVESAHDERCELPWHDAGAPLDSSHSMDCPVCAQHRHCVLWPAKRTASFLSEQRATFDNDPHFEMVYFNKPRPESAVGLTEQEVNRCRNFERRLGQYPAGAQLIAGLDPASDGMQCAFLWAWHPETEVRYMVDLDMERGGGLPGARRVVREWYERHRCLVWVVERNGYQKAVMQDRDILDFTSVNGISVRPHFTDKFNKFDPYFGVNKMFELYRATPPLVDLPYGDEASQDKVRLFRQQLVSFEGATRRTQTDLVMASWFPETVIRRWRREHQAVIHFTGDFTSYPFGALGDAYRSA